MFLGQRAKINLSFSIYYIFKNFKILIKNGIKFSVKRSVFSQLIIQGVNQNSALICD